MYADLLADYEQKYSIVPETEQKAVLDTINFLKTKLEKINAEELKMALALFPIKDGGDPATIYLKYKLDTNIKETIRSFDRDY